jgi:hypothetical protein
LSCWVDTCVVISFRWIIIFLFDVFCFSELPSTSENLTSVRTGTFIKA